MTTRQEQDAARNDTRLTCRPTSAAMEELLFRTLPVLDHGFVRVIDYMGDDSSIVQAARVSYGRGTKTTSDDRALIRYLVRHRHTSPLEMAEIKLHVKLPIFVARQWIRHRTASVNEVSARYSILDREFYIPSVEHVAAQNSLNKQGRGEQLSYEDAQHAQRLIFENGYREFNLYEKLLAEPESNGLGVARELARTVLPLSTYTQWYWKCDLHNLLHFLALRMDPHAQLEMRLYADAIAKIVQAWVPLAWEAFVDYRLEGATLSRMELAAVQQLVEGKAPDLSEMSEREKREFNERWLSAPWTKQ